MIVLVYVPVINNLFFSFFKVSQCFRSVLILIQLTQYLSRLKLGLEWEWKIFSCQLYSNISRSNVFAEWMSMALVASSRCYSIVQPIKSRKFFSKRNLCIIVILNKIYGFVLLIPFNFGVSDFFSDFFKKFFTLSKNRKYSLLFFKKFHLSVFSKKDFRRI